MPAFTSRPNAFTQSAVEATNLSCVGNTAAMTFSRDSAANLSRIEQLRKELEALRGVERMREQLSAKNKSLEQEVKLLRRELHRKSIDRTPPTSQANPTVRRTAPTPSNASCKT